MNNFVYYNPAKIVFGRGTIGELSGLLPGGAKVLLVYGGGSIKRNGVYGQVIEALRGFEFVEFSGIEANPCYETCMEAVGLCASGSVDFILAVGGGSVLDAAKFIAAASRFAGDDPWDILAAGAPVQSALPLGAVLTLPATGSEANGNSVVSRRETREKLAFSTPLVIPRFSILDPETTFSLPARQVRNGVVDAFAHVMEQYMTFPAAAPLQDRLAESILATLAEVGRGNLDKPGDYDSRASLVWSATLALNTLIGCGVPQDWSTHMIGHELTALYGIDHAESLAIVLFGVWRWKLEAKRAKLEQYGKRVWGVDGAEAAIEATREFFHSLDMPTTLAAHQIDPEAAAAEIQSRFERRGAVFGEHGDIDGAAAAAIIRSLV